MSACDLMKLVTRFLRRLGWAKGALHGSSIGGNVVKTKISTEHGNDVSVQVEN